MRRLVAVKGLACGGCARGLEKRIGRLDGVRHVGVHHLSASMLVDWDDKRTGMAAIAAAVAGAGYGLIERHRPEELSAMLADDIRHTTLRLAVAVVAGMWSMALAIVLYVTELGAAVAWWIAFGSGVLALPVLTWAGAGIFWMALRSIKLRTPGMDLLIALGAGGAFVISFVALASGSSDVYFDTATMLVTLLLVGRLVDLITRRGAIDALKALEDASAETVVRRSAGQDEMVPASSIAIGDRVVIDAGAIVGVDGVVETGESRINRAILTGESRPIAVGVGERVEAGAINLRQRLIVSVDQDHGDREIDRMGGAIALELAQRGTRATGADRLAGILSWGIPAVAALTAGIAPIFGVAGLDAILRGLTVLAAACPCALSIAAPLARTRAAGIAARLGFRLREPSAFEALARPATVIFDKTGTLTTGEPRVVEVTAAPGRTEREVLALAARAETGIDHPLARAIVARHGREEGSGGIRRERSAEACDGEGRRIAVFGSEREDGRTSLAVTLDGLAIGTLSLADSATADAHRTIERLAGQGAEIWIASGDARGPTLHVADALGIAPGRVRYGCTPADKVELVKAQAGPVVFVGDGVNDAPALAAADCGISVASAHSAAAQTADLAIVRGGIGQMVPAIGLARRTMTITRQNLALAVIYNLAVLPFAISGLLTPVLAALAMFASSMSVSLNSLRLKPPPPSRPGKETAPGAAASLPPADLATPAPNF